MYRQARCVLLGLAIGLWIVALGIYVHVLDIGASRLPTDGLLAIAGTGCGLAWLIVYLHALDMAARDAAMKRLTDQAKPTSPAPAGVSACDPADVDGPTLGIAYREEHTPPPMPRVFVAYPGAAPRDMPTVEMIRADEAAREFAALYTVARKSGFDEGFGAAAGFTIPDDDRMTNGHDLSGD